MLTYSLYFFAFVSIANCFKIGSVYAKNRNRLSIIMILTFIVAAFLGMFSPFAATNHDKYYIGVSISVLFYVAGLCAIIFYILDIKQLAAIPLLVAILIFLQVFIGTDNYFRNSQIFDYTMGLVPIIGFFYLASKNKDGKSFGMAIHFILVIPAGILTEYNELTSAIFYFGSALMSGLSIFGAFEGIFKKEKKKVSWIEKKLTEKVK